MNERIEKTLSRKILLNPGPATTTPAVKQALLVEDICPREAEFGDLIDRVRRKCVAVVHGEADCETVLLGASGTGAIESCLVSCMAPGDSVLIIDNGAYGARMHSICRALGIECECLAFDWGEPVDLERVADFVQQHQQRLGALAFVHHETTVGLLNPLDALTELGKQHGLDVIVDAMSSYAGMAIDLRTSPIDYLISSSNKCIQGMAGLGIVIARRDALERTGAHDRRAFYLDLYRNYRSQAHDRQFLFTPPVQVLYALDAALDEFFEETGPARFARYASLYRDLLEGMSALGFRSLVAPEHHAGLLTAFVEPEHPHYDFEAMHDFFLARGITIYPGKCPGRNSFRIATIGALGPKDIRRFLDTMAEYLASRSIAPLYRT